MNHAPRRLQPRYRGGVFLFPRELQHIRRYLHHLPATHQHLVADCPLDDADLVAVGVHLPRPVDQTHHVCQVYRWS